ncbi:MAG TPA: allantoate amidohydrolase [Acidobacteriaceae bacterium]|nr:allantoate amidohydrolase [Acidobacteriaceae bacterium]
MNEGAKAEATAARILARCAELARCTETPGAICRTFLSLAMDEAHALLRRWAVEAGMTVQLDRAGNFIASTKAAEDTPRLMIGSHLDTVPDAGAYDGVLGVLLGLAIAEAQSECGLGIDVVGFSDEEGVRFGTPFIGSKSMTGRLTAELLGRRDGAGVTAREALDAFAKARPDAVSTGLPQGVRGYLEFHIEQGPVLESEGLALGVVTKIAGQSRGVLTFVGRAGHAGTTPMVQRQDALAAAAEWIGRVEEIAHGAEGLVATVGQISAEPNAVNVIAAGAKCSLDVRHAEDAVRTRALSEIVRAAEEIAARRGVRCGWSETHTEAAVPMDAAMIAMVEQAVERAGHPVRRMASGAGHDAMVLAPHVPSGMIFLRCPGGLSHHPDEAVLAGDLAAAFKVGLLFLDEFERAWSAGERRTSA